ncbi:hypothetical protein FOQG_01801 [Fusarium oxysporum f. sp. raphani 54005]|uniref:Uncharacterized protein n=2 Tax=Fusarium oxysporum TaxID=5507 RepID=X0D6Q3_FUSOX|nr:hypothetical protein FOVG_09648 [Fusarium oxysporum f. sp. pisi HDV247]EXK99213.1 hypothetical protein FOQG_01801 [Fusarium oxysporum f. sp. raphani 54005]
MTSSLLMERPQASMSSDLSHTPTAGLDCDQGAIKKMPAPHVAVEHKTRLPQCKGKGSQCMKGYALDYFRFGKGLERYAKRKHINVTALAITIWLRTSTSVAATAMHMDQM